MGNNLIFELKPHLGIETDCESVTLEIINPENEIDAKLDEINNKISGIDISVDKYTNHADNIDYAIAVASGILTGIIDSFLIDEIDLKECHEYGNEKVENLIKKLSGENDLEKAIQNLEKRTKNFFPSDPMLNDFGGGKQHHLRDFAHHPTPIGLTFSLLTQFTKNCYGTKANGRFTVVPLKDETRIGKSFSQKIIYGTLYWFIHLVSDMAGSKEYAGKGTGIPGPILSLAKELSSLPIFKSTNKKGDKEISVFTSKLFNGTLFAEKDSSGKIIKETIIPIDLRTEIGIIHKQSIPIIINECIVRVFYSIRRFETELKSHPISNLDDFFKLNIKAILPFGNRTVERMMTIASGTFSAFDFADATIRSGGLNSSLLLRLNFVGIGRFTVALGTDVYMGWRKGKLSKERMLLKADSLYLLEAKIYHGEALMWSALKDANESIDSLLETIQLLTSQTSADIKAVQNSITEIEQIDISLIEEKNQDLIEDLLNTL